MWTISGLIGRGNRYPQWGQSMLFPKYLEENLLTATSAHDAVPSSVQQIRLLEDVRSDNILCLVL